MSRGEAPFRSPGSALLVTALLLSCCLLAIDAAPLLAPGPVGDAALVALAPSCHQDPSRSPRLAGRRAAACWRCVGIHAAGALAACVAAVLGVRGLRPARRRLGQAAVLLTALMAGQAVAGMLLPSTDLPAARALTGLLAGAAVIAWGAARMSEEAAQQASPSTAQAAAVAGP